eukprot:bmy_05050T0
MPHILGCPTTRPLTKGGCPEPLAIELFTLKPRKLGKHQNLHVECAQADFEKLLLWAHGGSMSAKHVCDRSHVLSYGGAENPCESVEGTSTVRKLNLK